MNAYLRIASEAYRFAANNCENEEILKFVDDAISWTHETSCEDDFGVVLANTSIEAQEGIYWLSSLNYNKDLAIFFPTLLNAVCVAYALYLEGYKTNADIIEIGTDEIDEVKAILGGFLTTNIDVSKRRLNLSHEWALANVPF
jgi:hypothetical protein